MLRKERLRDVATRLEGLSVASIAFLSPPLGALTAFCAVSTTALSVSLELSEILLVSAGQAVGVDAATASQGFGPDFAFEDSVPAPATARRRGQVRLASAAAASSSTPARRFRLPGAAEASEMMSGRRQNAI
jgi:hypothetical protein